MTSIDELKVGDPIVIKHRHVKQDGPYEKTTVEKVTKTSITAGGMRFNRRNGDEWGYSSSWSYTVPTCIAWTDGWRKVMSYEEADQCNAEWLAERQYNALVNEISGVRYKRLSLKTLQAIKALVDAELNTDEDKTDDTE